MAAGARNRCRPRRFQSYASVSVVIRAFFRMGSDGRRLRFLRPLTVEAGRIGDDVVVVEDRVAELLRQLHVQSAGAPLVGASSSGAFPGLPRVEGTSELACPKGTAWKDVPMPKPYPQEFRDDVVKVARNRPEGTTLEQIALISGSTDDVVEVDEVARPSMTGSVPA
jgi:hypothetical protein